MNRLLIPLLFLGLPLAEIATFVLVGRQIGVFATIGLVIAATAAGVMMLRAQGSSAAQRLRRAAADGSIEGRDLADGALIMLAGILLVIPGFLTDVAGLLLFIPPVRRLIRRGFGDRVTIVTSGMTGGFGRAGFGPGGFGQGGFGRGSTIDLDESEYARKRQESGPPRRLEDDRSDDEGR